MAAYKFELKAETSLREAGIEVYLPKETIYVKKPRRRPVAVERPAISTLIFVHASWNRIIDYKRRVDDRLKFKMTPIVSSATPNLSSDKAYLTVPTPPNGSLHLHLGNPRHPPGLPLSSPGSPLPPLQSLRPIHQPLTPIPHKQQRHHSPHWHPCRNHHRPSCRSPCHHPHPHHRPLPHHPPLPPPCLPPHHHPLPPHLLPLTVYTNLLNTHILIGI